MDKFLKNSKGFTPIVGFDEVLIKSKRSKEPSPKFTTGFTLIELLVVVAIIGILSSVVIASINSVREKNKVALIKSTLKQLYSQVALNQLNNGSFSGSNDGNLNCTGPNNNLAKIAQPLVDIGVFVKCFSNQDLNYNDVYLRFGATALIYDTSELKAWSVDENGIVKWDNGGVDLSGQSIGTDTIMQWQAGVSACALSGGRLPSVEQLRSLAFAWYQGSGYSTYTPVGFSTPFRYWSSNPAPYTSKTVSFGVNVGNGNATGYYQDNRNYDLKIRCVR